MNPKTALLLPAMVLVLSATGCNKGPTVERVGDSLQAFIVQDCEESKKYCQVCAYSGKPTIMAVGEIGDAGFEKDLVAIQRLITDKGEAGLTAFAVVGQLDGKGIKPYEDEADALAKLRATRSRLGITFPVAIVPREVSESQKKNYYPFNALYRIKASRTVLFAGADNKITFAEVITSEQQHDKLATTVQKAL